METKLSAILLAGGRSTRMGTAKQLLPVRDRPAVVGCVENISQSGVADIVVVVNPADGRIIEALSGLPVSIAVNDIPESDMADSVRAALKVINPSSTGVFVCLCDHPLVTSATFSAMGVLHRNTPDQIIIPVFQERKGHPTLFPYDVLLELRDCDTLRDVIHSHGEKIMYLDVTDEGTILDMDTPEDYQRILDRCGNESL